MEARLEYKKTYDVEHVEDALIDNAKSVKKFERVKCRLQSLIKVKLTSYLSCCCWIELKCSQDVLVLLKLTEAQKAFKLGQKNYCFDILFDFALIAHVFFFGIIMQPFTVVL